MSPRAGIYQSSSPRLPGGGGWSSRHEKSWLARPLLWIPLGAFLCFAVVVLRRSPAPLQTVYSAMHRQAPAQPPPPPSEFDCNPFQAPGRLVVDLQTPTNNVWKPYDPKCPPSGYLKALYRAQGDTSPVAADSTVEGSVRSSTTRQHLGWLTNATVVIHGDSIDRYHLKDFCQLVQGRLSLVSQEHLSAPPAYHMPHVPDLGLDGLQTAASIERKKLRDMKEAAWEARPMSGQDLTNPWVCDLPEYGFTMISVFTFGLEGGESFYGTERWYHPPATYSERFEHITVPLLSRLALALDRPQITTPSLIEINSGFWDLRRFTEEDFTVRGYSRPYPEDSDIPYQMIGQARETAWENELRKAIKGVARHFKGDDGTARSGPPILWRTLHHPPRHNYAPYNRVFALDSLARKTIADLQAESIPSRYGPPLSHRITLEEAVEGEDLGLDQRLRLDEWGALMLGQEHHFRDLLHPDVIPGSYLWGDIMLYELKRAVTSKERDNLFA